MVVNKPPLQRKVQPAPQWSTRAGGAPGKGAKYAEAQNPAPLRKKATTGPDLVNRDPWEINTHIKVGFEDVLTEPINSPKSVHSVWAVSWGCYTCWKDTLYKLCTFFTACCCAARFACDCAWIAYCHIWICSPFTVCFRKCCLHGIGRLFKQCFSCCIAPFASACGEMFWAFGDKGKPFYPNEPYMRPNERAAGKTGNTSVPYYPMQPYMRANENNTGKTGKPGKPDSKVKFNDKVKTKTIPRNSQVGTGIGGQKPVVRATAGQTPAKNGPTVVKPAGKNPPTTGAGQTPAKNGSTVAKPAGKLPPVPKKR